MSKARLTGILDQERADLREWMLESDMRAMTDLRLKLSEDDSLAMLARLSPDEADVVARLAIIAFDEAAMEHLTNAAES